MSSLDYNGVPIPTRPRRLSELEGQKYIEDKPPIGTKEATERQDAVNNLFNSVAKTFLKGEKLLEAIGNMGPAQWIPIEVEAIDTAEAARRLAGDESVNGTRITFSMFQKSVQALLERRREIAASFEAEASIPIHTRTISTKVEKSQGTDWISEFYKGNGVAGSLLGALTVSIFFSDVFASLTVEEPAKGLFSVKVIQGIAVLLAFGVQVESILRVLKGTGSIVPEVQTVLERMANDPSSKDDALRSLGIDPKDLQENQKANDAATIVKYSEDYAAANGGLIDINGIHTMDHWVAYGQVAGSHELMSDALGLSDSYSTDIKNLSNNTDSPLAIGNHLASGLSELAASIDANYNTLANVLLFDLDDRLLCCLVHILGSQDPTWLKNIARILRILSIDAYGIIAGMYARMKVRLSDVIGAILLHIIEQLNTFYGQVVGRLMADLNITGVEECPGLFIIFSALMDFPQKFKDWLNKLLRDLFSHVDGLIQVTPGEWAVTADRKQLLAIAKILDILAARLTKANLCDTTIDPTSNNNVIAIEDTPIDVATRTLLQDPPIAMKMSQEDKDLYFPNTSPVVGPLLGTTYRMGTQQIQGNPSTTSSPCADKIPIERLDAIRSALEQSISSNNTA